MMACGSIPNNHPSAPASLVAVIENTVRGMDQKLGYHGRDRWVLFYYEPRGEEVIWRDSRSYGFATGAWEIFMDQLAPLADLYKVDLGQGGSPGKHVLLIDRVDHRAYFVEAGEAIRRLAGGNRQSAKGAAPARAETLEPMESSVEISQETITQLAYEIWERRGRPQGQNLQDWLEAEAQLRKSLKSPGQSK